MIVVFTKHCGMKNEFWIFCKSKKCFELVIDLYDESYMDQSREERFAALRSLLENDIMNIRRVYVQWEDNGMFLELKKAWYAVERISEIHHLLEEAYGFEYFRTWYDRNPAMENGSLTLDEEQDNSVLPHYKLTDSCKKPGEVYLNGDGEACTLIEHTECRVCDLVWEAFVGRIPQGFRVEHIDGDKRNNKLSNLVLKKIELYGKSN